MKEKASRKIKRIHKESQRPNLTAAFHALNQALGFCLSLMFLQQLQTARGGVWSAQQILSSDRAGSCPQIFHVRIIPVFHPAPSSPRSAQAEGTLFPQPTGNGVGIPGLVESPWCPAGLCWAVHGWGMPGQLLWTDAFRELENYSSNILSQT